MKTPLAVLAVIAALLSPAAFSASAAADAPPEGKYRCYLPPDYGVLAWFEVSADGVAFNGGDPEEFAFDAAARRIDWPAGAIAPYRYGFLYPAGASGGDAERTTIILARQRNVRPGQAGWSRLPRCYLTTH